MGAATKEATITGRKLTLCFHNHNKCSKEELSSVKLDKT